MTEASHSTSVQGDEHQIMNYRINNTALFFQNYIQCCFYVRIVLVVFLRAHTHTRYILRSLSTCSHARVSSVFRPPAVRPRFPADPHLPARSQWSMTGCCWSTAPEEGQGGGKDKQERGDILSFPEMLSRVTVRKMWRDLHFD